MDFNDPNSPDLEVPTCTLAWQTELPEAVICLALSPQGKLAAVRVALRMLRLAVHSRRLRRPGMCAPVPPPAGSRRSAHRALLIQRISGPGPVPCEVGSHLQEGPISRPPPALCYPLHLPPVPRRPHSPSCLAPRPPAAQVGTCESEIHVLDVGSGEVRFRLAGHEGGTNALAFLGGNTLASVGEDGRARLWNVGRQACTHELAIDAVEPDK